MKLYCTGLQSPYSDGFFYPLEVASSSPSQPLPGWPPSMLTAQLYFETPRIQQQMRCHRFKFMIFTRLGYVI
jgi:hypothetical protein